MRSEKASSYRDNALSMMSCEYNGCIISLGQLNRTECDTARLQQKCRTVIQLA